MGYSRDMLSIKLPPPLIPGGEYPSSIDNNTVGVSRPYSNFYYQIRINEKTQNYRVPLSTLKSDYSLQADGYMMMGLAKIIFTTTMISFSQRSTLQKILKYE